MSVDLACEHEMHHRDKEEFTSFTVAFWLVQFHGSGSFLHEIGLVQRPRHACSQPPYFSTKLSRRSIQAWWRRQLLSSSSFLFLLLKTHPANFILIPQIKSFLASSVAKAAPVVNCLAFPLNVLVVDAQLKKFSFNFAQIPFLFHN